MTIKVVEDRKVCKAALEQEGRLSDISVRLDNAETVRRELVEIIESFSLLKRPWFPAASHDMARLEHMLHVQAQVLDSAKELLDAEMAMLPGLEVEHAQ